MLIAELTMPATTQDAGVLLQQAGYQPFGGPASFAKVWKKPNESWVLKLFTNRDEGFLAFLNLIQNYPSPHWPVIRGRPVKINNEYSAVRTELLTPPPPGTWKYIEQCGNYLGALQLFDQTKDANLIDEIMAFRQQNKPMAALLSVLYQKIIKSNPNMMNDIDVRNSGMRGNVIVFFDPIGWGGGPPLMGESIEPTDQELKAIDHDKTLKKRARMRDFWVIDPGAPATALPLSGMGV